MKKIKYAIAEYYPDVKFNTIFDLYDRFIWSYLTYDDILNYKKYATVENTVDNLLNARPYVEAYDKCLYGYIFTKEQIIEMIDESPEKLKNRFNKDILKVDKYFFVWHEFDNF